MLLKLNFGSQAYFLFYKTLVPGLCLFLPFAFCSTYLKIVRLTFLVSINIFKAVLTLVFVIEFAELLFLFIQLIFEIFYYLYNWQRLIISIMSCFLLVVLNLIKYLYSNFKSVQITIVTLY